MGWRIFKSTDSGAPTGALNVSGNLAAILRACLIDGYGTIDPVGGWEEPFTESGGVAVFRATAGNRQFYQFADIAGSYAVISGYESMSDLTTGSGKWPYASYNFGKYYTTSNMKWVVFANEYTVVFIGCGQYGWIPQVFGEYTPLFTGTSYNNCIIGVYSSSLRETYSPFNDFSGALAAAVSATGRRVALHRLPNGTALGVSVGLTGGAANLSGASSWQYAIPLDLSATMRPLLSPILLFGPPDTTVVSSGNDYYGMQGAWGVVPRIYSMSIPVVDFSAEAFCTVEWEDTDTGLTYLLFPFGSYVYSSYDRIAFAIPLAEVS